MKKVISFLAMLLLFTACEVFEPYEQSTYYNITGEGYVYYYDTKEPASNVNVFVESWLEEVKYANVPIKEIYLTDDIGYFSVRFLKRVHRRDIMRCWISPGKEDYYSDYSFFISVEELQKFIGTVQVDTLWLKKSNILK